jgi:hypothetical protein
MYEWKDFFLKRTLKLSPVDSISSCANFDGFRSKMKIIIKDRELSEDEALQLKYFEHKLQLKDAGYDSENMEYIQCKCQLFSIYINL